MDHMVITWHFVEDLILIKNTKDTVIFLLLSTLGILNYETAIPIAMVAMAVFLLSTKYYHKKFTPWEPLVKTNVEFIRFGAQMTVDHK